MLSILSTIGTPDARARRVLLSAALFALGACGGPPPAPVVDMQGVDPMQYNRDLAECVNKTASTAFAFGNPTTDCMSAKGYKILVGY